MLSCLYLPVFSIFVALVSATYHCMDFFVPINVTAPSFEVAFAPFQTQSQAIPLLLAVSSSNISSASSVFKTQVNASNSFEISASYCRPSGKSATAVQVLTHGLGFDKQYWQWNGPGSQYDYIQAATDAGYATLSYDRLGTGQSSKPNPYNVVQGPTELAVLVALTEKLWSGALNSKVPAPSTVVHVGHSYGSILTHGLAATAPTLSSGIVLTGYSTNFTWLPQWMVSTLFNLASQNQPARFGNLSSGYVTWDGIAADQYGFFHYPNFAPAVLEKAEATKWPFTIGESLTGALLLKVAPAFAKPVLIVSGLYDLIFCGADCENILEPAAQFFPKASVFETYLQPNTGHGLNLHYNATGTYQIINDFFNANV